MDIKMSKQTIHRLNNYSEICRVPKGKLIRILLDYIDDNEDIFLEWYNFWAESQYGVDTYD